jgi:hypothetical protein
MGDREVPGVADSIRRTNLTRDKDARKKDMDEILRMVHENRLHEADERQLENLSLALELKKLIGEKTAVDANDLNKTITDAITAALQNIPTISTVNGFVAADVNRPGMKHISLADLQQTEDRVEISNIEITETKPGEEDAASKLSKLKKLKGNG